jgi:hypothetical protein
MIPRVDLRHYSPEETKLVRRAVADLRETLQDASPAHLDRLVALAVMLLDISTDKGEP